MELAVGLGFAFVCGAILGYWASLIRIWRLEAELSTALQENNEE